MTDDITAAVTENDRAAAARLVGSLEDEVLRRLLVGDIAFALAAERIAARKAPKP